MRISDWSSDVCSSDRQESGAFVFMVSASGLIGAFGQANYAAAKLGMTALSKSIAIDMKRYNVRSNCISPVAWSRMVSSIPTDTPEQKARSEEHPSELQSLMRISYAVFCLKQKNKTTP